MKRVLLLQNQIIEATRFSNSDQPDLNRLGLILLDNFIEIQLTIQLSQYKDNQYLKEKFNIKDKEFKNARKHYDCLLKLSSKLQLIDKKYSDILKFCHGLRNTLYHETIGEFDLIKIGNSFLLEIIRENQPIWRSGRMFTIHDEFHPIKNNPNSFESWVEFLDGLILKDHTETQKTLYENLNNKINYILESYEYLSNDFVEIVRKVNSNELNSILKYYCFHQEHEDTLSQDTRESPEESYKRINLLMIDFNKKWRLCNADYFKSLSIKTKNIMKKDNITDLFSEYTKYSLELNRYYQAIRSAAIDFDTAVQNGIQYYKDRS